MLITELVTTLDRKKDSVDGGGANPPPRFPRRDRGPREGGKYWMRGTAMVRITGSANIIVNLAGQFVMLHPEQFGLTSDEIMGWLKSYGEAQYSPAHEYQSYLDGAGYDLSRVPLLHNSSKAVFQQMLRMGWAYVEYQLPDHMYLVVTPDLAKRALASAAESLPLMQMDEITVTLVTDFNSIGSPGRAWMSRNNKTLTFRAHDNKGFAGPFGAAMDWLSTGSAPASNYLYFLAYDYQRELHSTVKNVMTENGYRKRYGITFFVKPPAAGDDMVLSRVPLSLAFNNMTRREQGKSGLTPEARNGTCVLYSDRPFSIYPRDIEVFRDGKWQQA